MAADASAVDGSATAAAAQMLTAPPLYAIKNVDFNKLYYLKLHSKPIN